MYLAEALEEFYRTRSSQSHLGILSLFYLKRLYYTDQDFQRACRFATHKIVLNWIYYDGHFGKRISRRSLNKYYSRITGDSMDTRFAKWVIQRHPNFITKMSIRYIVG